MTGHYVGCTIAYKNTIYTCCIDHFGHSVVILQAQVPKILDKNTLEITVDNNIQQGYFNDEQKDLVPWLRKKLDNFALRFEVKMTENVQTKKLYLPEEKFKHMVEKNPNLLYLREKLNTDLE